MSVSKKYELTENGRKKIHDHLEYIKAQRDELFYSGKDTVDETSLPNEEEMFYELVEKYGFDERGESFNVWEITDHHWANKGITLTLGRDVVENIEAVNGINIIPVYANLLEDGCYGDIYTSYDECKAEHPNQEVKYGYYADIEDGPDFFETVYEAEDYIKGLDKEIDI